MTPEARGELRDVMKNDWQPQDLRTFLREHRQLGMWWLGEAIVLAVCAVVAAAEDRLGLAVVAALLSGYGWTWLIATARRGPRPWRVVSFLTRRD
jgi:hypothetical protein